jgi:cytidylate kinase
MIITIDGPAGVGKSSGARALARRLNFAFLDTGAMFRAVTLAVLRAGLDPRDEEGLARLLERIHLDMPADRVLLDGEDVSEAIRASEITAASGAIADSPVVRQWMVRMQRALTQGQDVVSEGRDQGTIVFPEAECKFYLIADPQERARRRYKQCQARGESVTLEEVLRAQEQRDARDAARALAPMKPAADAIVLDNTHLTPEEGLEQMLQEVRRLQEQREEVDRATP